VIIGFEGRAIESAQEFGFRVGTVRIGESRIVEYRRGDREFETRLQMVAAPETTPRDELTVEAKSPFEGLTVANLSPAVAEEVGMAADATGVVVTEVGKGLAQRFFKKGDLLLLVNRKEIASVKDLRDALAEEPDRWSIAIERGGKPIAIRQR
jgi:S1-C subfamily serine protease